MSASRDGDSQSLNPGTETPEQLIAMLEEYQRQGGSMDQVPPELTVSSCLPLLCHNGNPGMTRSVTTVTTPPRLCLG